MRTLIATCVFVSISAVGRAADEPRSLADAVNEFNLRQLEDDTGKLQPPLTKEEVIAAIRGWIRKQIPVADETYNAFQEIADSGELPARADLSFITNWNHNGYDFDGWWVTLSIMTGEKMGYSFGIRQQMIRSQPQKIR